MPTTPHTFPTLEPPLKQAEFKSSEQPLPGLMAGVGAAGYLGPATVVGLDEAQRLVLVQWERAGQRCLSWAQPALTADAQLNPGDTALVLSHTLEDFYLIGLLSRSAAVSQPAASALQSRAGANVTVSQSSGEETIKVHSKRGELVLEYRPGSGKTVVNVESGDLEFVTRNGSIAFHSARKISFVAHRVETIAETLVSKVRNAYRTVEELAQLQAGRLRILTKGSCHLKARDAYLKAEQDFKVDGEQIHLG